MKSPTTFFFTVNSSHRRYLDLSRSHRLFFKLNVLILLLLLFVLPRVSVADATGAYSQMPPRPQPIGDGPRTRPNHPRRGHCHSSRSLWTASRSPPAGGGDRSSAQRSDPPQQQQQCSRSRGPDIAVDLAGATGRIAHVGQVKKTIFLHTHHSCFVFFYLPVVHLHTIHPYFAMFFFFYCRIVLAVLLFSFVLLIRIIVWPSFLNKYIFVVLFSLITLLLPWTGLGPIGSP